MYHRKQPLIVLDLIAIAYTKVDFSWKSKSEPPFGFDVKNLIFGFSTEIQNKI